MYVPALLDQPHLTVVSGEPDFELQNIARIIAHSVTVDGRGSLAAVLDRWLAEVERSTRVSPRTLDLIGHTRTRGSLVALGGWIIDGADPRTVAFVRELADREVLPRLGVHAVRLLGCNSAGTAQGRATIAKLSDLLGLEVLGADHLLHAAHYGERGFHDCWSFLLVSASQLRRDALARAAPAAGDPHARVLDVDALPAVVLDRHGSCPRRIASIKAARRILGLVRHREGARMPGLAVEPSYELALPAATPGTHHVAHVLLDGEFLRFYPDGMTAAVIAIPDDDASALRRIVAALSSVP